MKLGKMEGKYFSPRRMEEITKPMAMHLETNVVGIKNIEVWYDAKEDYDKIEFDLEGSHYVVQYYKVWAVTKDGRNNYPNKKNFGRSDYELEEFFTSGQYRNWHLVDAI